MKILVAIPVYDGKLPVQTVRCLLEEQLLVFGGGDELSVQFLPGCSHPAVGRNQLARDFLASQADRLVFLDSDVTWERGALLKIAQRPVDFVGGAYRLKLDEEAYPVVWNEDPRPRGIKLSETEALIEVRSVPGGFLSLSRRVFDVLKAWHPERVYSHMGHALHAYFTMPFQDGALYGEDSYFCKEWLDVGGKVYLDPGLALTHWDFNHAYPGHIGRWLKARAGVAPAA